ncbi:MAG TPA: chemotaxis protein CheD [Spirochaetales bacterium]|nr:chemotaxis protein CheD [Spirochaetales bacterium]
MFTLSYPGARRTVLTIHPGEYLVSGDDVLIATVLGSCVSVSLYDPRRSVGGLNHFMLPESLNGKDLARSEPAKYGMYAIELLYNDFLKGGSRKADLEAKVFGGASILGLSSGPKKIAAANVDFALDYLEREGIRVAASDTGGSRPRKIFLEVRTGRVLRKFLGGVSALTLSRKEDDYLAALRSMDEPPVSIFRDRSPPPDA